MKKTLAVLLAMAMMVTVLFTGCGNKAPASSAAPSTSTESGSGSEATPAEEPLKIAVILPGKKDDLSFNQAMYDSMRAVENTYGEKIAVTYVEEVYEVTDIEPALMDYAAQGYDLIFGHGFQFMEPIVKVAKLYPDVAFSLGMGYKTEDNSCVYDVHLDAGGYMMGVLAATLTKTGKVGIVGGADVAEIHRGHEAFKYGVKQTNPDVEVQEIYTGDFTRIDLAKEAASSIYDAGADIIWHSGDGVGIGVVTAAAEKNKMVLGNLMDQTALAPENVVSGVIYGFEKVISDIIDDVVDGSFKTEKDKFYWITVPNGNLTYAPLNPKYATPEATKAIEDAYNGLKDGTITLPTFE